MQQNTLDKDKFSAAKSNISDKAEKVNQRFNNLQSFKLTVADTKDSEKPIQIKNMRSVDKFENEDDGITLRVNHTKLTKENSSPLKENKIAEKESRAKNAFGVLNDHQALQTRQAASLDPSNQIAGGLQNPQRGLMFQQYNQNNLLNSQSSLRSPKASARKYENDFGSAYKLKVQQINSNTKKSNYKEFQMEVNKQKSEFLEDELYAQQTHLRKREGKFLQEIAVLKQQITQMESQRAEASNLERIQRQMHEKILEAVNELISTQDNQPTTILNLMNFKNIVMQADGVFKDTMSQKSKSGGKRDNDEHLCKSYAQIEEKNEIIEKYESQNKLYFQEINDIQAQNTQLQQTVEYLQSKNEEMIDKIQRLGAAQEEQKKREANLKTLHNDEMKYISDMNGHELKLYQSKIKELESIIQSYHRKSIADDNGRSASPFLQRSINLNYSYVDQKSPSRINSLSKRHFSNPGLPLTQRQSPNGAMTRAASVLAILESEKDAKIIMPPEIISCNNIITLSSGKKEVDKENKNSGSKNQELENALTQAKKIINYNLTNHKEATDRLKLQLKEANSKICLKDDENKQLQSKLSKIKLQISKLEKVQLADLSRSRSGSRHAEGFKFRQGTKIIQMSQQSDSLSPPRQGSNTARGQMRSGRLGIMAKHLQQSIQSLEDSRDPTKRQKLFTARNKQSTRMSVKDLVFNENGLGRRSNQDMRSQGPKVQDWDNEQSLELKNLSLEKSQEEAKSKEKNRSKSKKSVQGVINLSKYLSNAQKNEKSSIPPFDLKNVLDTDQKHKRESDRKRRMRANLRSNSRSNNIIANQTEQKNDLKQVHCQEIKLELNDSLANDFKSQSQIEIGALRVMQESGLGVIENSMIGNPLAKSILCDASPSKYRLEQIESPDNCSQGAGQKHHYFGNVSPRKKLITNLSQVSHAYGQSQLNVKYESKKNMRPNSPSKLLSLVEQESSMQISPVKQEAHKSAIHDLVKNETCLQSRQQKERFELYNENRSPLPRMTSMSSQISMRSNELMIDKQKLIKAIFNHNDETQMLESPPRMPQDTNRAKDHGSYVQDESGQLPSSNPAAVKAMKKAKHNYGHSEFLVMKFDELYNRIMRRDKKVSNLKDENQKILAALQEAKNQYQELLGQFEICDEERQNLILQNQKFDCRLKQAQVILNNGQDGLNLQVLEVDDNTNDQKSVSSRNDNLYFKKELNLKEKSHRDGSVRSIRQSIQDLEFKQGQLRNMENLRAIQAQVMQSARSGSVSSVRGSQFVGENSIQTSRVNQAREEKKHLMKSAQYNGSDSMMAFQSLKPAGLPKSPRNIIQKSSSVFSQSNHVKSKNLLKTQKLIVPKIDLASVNHQNPKGIIEIDLADSDEEPKKKQNLFSQFSTKNKSQHSMNFIKKKPHKQSLGLPQKSHIIDEDFQLTQRYKVDIDDNNSASEVPNLHYNENIDQSKFMTLQYPLKSALAEVNNKQNFFRDTKSNHHQIPVRSNTGMSQISAQSKKTSQKKSGYVGTLHRLLNLDEEKVPESQDTRRNTDDLMSADEVIVKAGSAMTSFNNEARKQYYQVKPNQLEIQNLSEQDLLMKIENQSDNQSQPPEQLRKSFQNLIDKRLKQKLQEESELSNNNHNNQEYNIQNDSECCNVTPENLSRKIKQIDNTTKVIQHQAYKSLYSMKTINEIGETGLDINLSSQVSNRYNQVEESECFSPLQSAKNHNIELEQHQIQGNSLNKHANKRQDSYINLSANLQNLSNSHLNQQPPKTQIHSYKSPSQKLHQNKTFNQDSSRFESLKSSNQSKPQNLQNMKDGITNQFNLGQKVKNIVMQTVQKNASQPLFQNQSKQEGIYVKNQSNRAQISNSKNQKKVQTTDQGKQKSARSNIPQFQLRNESRERSSGRKMGVGNNKNTSRVKIRAAVDL